MSNHANADSSILNEQLLRERERAEDLHNRVTKLNKEMSEANQRETDVRSIMITFINEHKKVDW